MRQIQYTAIGTIHSPFTETENMPIQPTGADGIEGTIKLQSEYMEGLRDLDGFSHIILLYHLHRSAGFSLTVTPFLDDIPRGLFATRAPKRPNPIGLSVVKLVTIEEHVLRIVNVDILDGTPLLDMKPYVPAMQPQEAIRTGWLSDVETGTIRDRRSDDRF